MLKKRESSRTLTRRDLCAAVYACRPGLSRAKARELFDITLDELSEALIRGETVKLRSFGIFKPRSKRQRVGRNPKTGESAVVCARRVLTFHPSPTLIARMNGEVSGNHSE